MFDSLLEKNSLEVINPINEKFDPNLHQAIKTIKNDKKDDNTVEQRIVEAGIVGDRDYEIISGLEVDEKIVTGSFIAISRELYDGAVVRVKENSRPNRNRG